MQARNIVSQPEAEQADEWASLGTRITEALMKRVRIAAAEHDTTIQEIVSRGIELQLADLSRKSKKK